MRVTNEKLIQSEEIVCAERCGRNCTRAEYLAVAAQAEQAEKEAGEGWEARVWDNLGWHWQLEALDGLVQVIPPRYGLREWCCFIQTTPQHIAHGATMRGAVRNALKMLEDRRRELGLAEVRVRELTR